MSHVIWFTGLSGAGKTSTSQELVKMLTHPCVQLDGDVLRKGLCSDLGFSDEHRRENIRRTGEVAKLMCDAGLTVIVACITPFARDRRWLRELLGIRYVEVFCDCPLTVCEKRDVKGLYKKARSGEIPAFTGISSPYEPPDNPHIVLHTAQGTPEDGARKIVDYLQQNANTVQ
ncbi:MAG: adenylyl-sulfate kinase [Desulfovibrio sp.]|nr:adenylyl-sulfate kinase [Desulfovibrio sp.]